MSKVLRGLEEMKKDRVRTPKKNKVKTNIFLDNLSQMDTDKRYLEISNKLNITGGGSILSNHNSGSNLNSVSSGVNYRSGSVRGNTNS